jgi:deoxyribodipyrimidine photolyase-like uncharacterized protein
VDLLFRKGEVFVKTLDLFKGKISVVNVGVKHFADSLKAQGVETAQVAWRPPINKKLSDLLRKVL